MNILFHSNQISERGTEIALYDYALGNQNYLNGISFIAAPVGNIVDPIVLAKFEKEFTVLLYSSIKEIETFIEVNDIELIYQIISGVKEPLLTKNIPSFLHCVFDTRSKYGDYYVPISSFLNRFYRTSYPVLPHIVKKSMGEEGTLRMELGIPQDATVFGGYGGKTQFDIPFVHRAIKEIINKREDIYFVFLNFQSFADDRRIIFLPKNTDIKYKERFINSCDAMIHARSDGETFGLSIAEFSVKNKPIITWKPNWMHNFKFKINTFGRYLRNKKHIYATAHLNFLGKKALTYSSYKTLVRKILTFDKKKYIDMDLDCYSERFSPEKVMNIFSSIVGFQKEDI